MRFQTPVLLFLALFRLSVGQCGAQCKFFLCKANGTGEARSSGTRLLLRGYNTALAPFICHPPLRLGRVLSTGEAAVAPLGLPVKPTPVPISAYSPTGLKRAFAKRYFQLFDILYLPGKQGVGRKRSRRNQNKFLDNLCVVLPVTKWQVLRKDGTVKRVVKRSRPSDCVSFRTVNSEILVELQWDSSDDFDLSVIEPDGDVVNRETRNSGSGRLNNDNGKGACNITPTGKENIIYDVGKVIQNGEYTVIVRHFNNCGNGPTKWMLRIIVDGAIVAEQDGSSNADDDAIVTMEKFTF